MSNCNFFLFVKLNIETHSVKGLSLYSVIAATSVITSQQNTHLQHHSHIMILIIITIIITCNRPVLSSVQNHHLNQMRNSKQPNAKENRIRQLREKKQTDSRSSRPDLRE